MKTVICYELHHVTGIVSPADRKREDGKFRTIIDSDNLAAHSTPARFIVQKLIDDGLGEMSWANVDSAEGLFGGHFFSSPGCRVAMILSLRLIERGTSNLVTNGGDHMRIDLGIVEV